MTNTLSQNGNIIKNPSAGIIRVVYSGATPYSNAGILAKFRFQLKTAMTNNYTTNLSIANTIINEGTPIINIDKNGSIKAINITSFNVSGQLTYDNLKLVEAMNNTKIFLINTNKDTINSVFTDATGNFKFPNVLPGSYSLYAKTSLAWGGCTSADALLVTRYFVGLIKSLGNPLINKAADVNNDGKITSSDALLITKRFVKLIKSFKIPDWLFDNVQFTVSDQDVIINFHAICAGDVNADRKF